MVEYFKIRLFLAAKGVVVTLVEISDQILQRLVRMETALEQGFRRVEEKLKAGESTFEFFGDAVRAQKERQLKDMRTSTPACEGLWQRARLDKERRFPHRKILDVLVGKFDFQSSQFQEVNFSRLVRESWVGKNCQSRAFAFDD